MDFSPILLLGISLGLAGFCLVFLRIRKLPAPLPPGPKRRPLLGNIRDLPPVGKPEWEHWIKHKELYGSISSVSVLGQTIIIISDYKIAFELLDKRNLNYSDRPVLKFSGEMIGWKLSLPLVRFNSRFRAYRKNFRQTIGTKSIITRFQSLQTCEARRFLLRVLEDPENLQDHVRTEAGAIILKLAYGYTIKPKGPDYLIELAERAMSQFSISAAPGKWIVDVIPALNNLPEWLPGMGFKKIAKQWQGTFKEFAERPYAFTKAQLASGTTIPSFTADSMLNGINSEEEELVIKHSAMSMYAGGADTTVSSISAFFLAMSLFPDVQRRAQEEIDNVIGTDRLPSFEDRPSLPYVEALVKEVYRWHPVVPMGFPHVASDDDIYNGMFIPKGAMLITNIWLFTHDKANYKDPHTFNPERFLGESAEMDPTTLIFGFGRRICPGKDFADESVFLTIALSLAAFDIRKARDGDGNAIEPRVEFTPGIISRPLPFLCDIRPRSDVAARLVREVEKEFPWEEGDDARLSGIRWE